MTANLHRYRPSERRPFNDKETDMMLTPPRNVPDHSSQRDPQGPQLAPEYAEAWKRTCRRLRAELGEDIFTSWFARLELHEVSAGTARLSVPTKFLKSWIHLHYTDRILAALAGEVTGIDRLVIEARSSILPGSQLRRSDPRPVSLGGFSEFPCRAPIRTTWDRSCRCLSCAPWGNP